MARCRARRNRNVSRVPRSSHVILPAVAGRKGSATFLCADDFLSGNFRGAANGGLYSAGFVAVCHVDSNQSKSLKMVTHNH